VKRANTFKRLIPGTRIEVLLPFRKRKNVFDLDGSVVIPDKVVPGRSWGKIRPKKIDTRAMLCLRLQCTTKENAVNRNLGEAVAGIFLVFLEAR
jgi:hypothetical protein